MVQNLKSYKYLVLNYAPGVKISMISLDRNLKHKILTLSVRKNSSLNLCRIIEIFIYLFI